MPAAEGSPDHRSSDSGSPSGLYVKHDLFPKSDREDDDMDHQPMLKLARYATSPMVHQQSFFEAHQSSSLPRRKQARPRRRSGDSSSSNTSPLSLPEPHFKLLMSTPSPVQDMPEDLSIKKSPVERQSSDESYLRSETPHSVNSAKESTSSESTRNDFERKSHQSPGPSIPSLLSSIIANSQPMSGNNNNILNLSINQQEDRRKGQHSAPRGGPPRAWTNGDLTEALNQVWNRKMTTSQASRVFGIPYNSLLMYVRGKYGKSLKLDTLRKETLEGEAMALAASTRGSYKLAALAAAATSSSGAPVLPSTPPKSAKLSKTSNTSSSGSTPAPPSISAKTIVNNNNNDTVNNNNNNNNNNIIKAPQKDVPLLKSPPLPGHLSLPNFPQHLNEMDALSMAQSLAGLGGFGAVNPYLSYFCDFSFPMPLALGGLLPPTPKVMRPADGLLKKVTDLRTDDSKKSKKSAKSDVEMNTHNSDVDTKVDRVKNPVPLLRPLIPTSLDMSQTGQV